MSLLPPPTWVPPTSAVMLKLITHPGEAFYGPFTGFCFYCLSWDSILLFLAPWWGSAFIVYHGTFPIFLSWIQVVEEGFRTYIALNLYGKQWHNIGLPFFFKSIKTVNSLQFRSRNSCLISSCNKEGE